MRVLSKAFSRLKTSLPWVPEDTKLSKLDTLRLASGYIAHLKQVLNDDGATSGSEEGVNPCGASSCLHPLTLTWPFTFNQRLPSPTGDGSKSHHAASCRDLDRSLAGRSMHRQHQPQFYSNHHNNSSSNNNHYEQEGDDPLESFLDYLSVSSAPAQTPYGAARSGYTVNCSTCAS